MLLRVTRSVSEPLARDFVFGVNVVSRWPDVLILFTLVTLARFVSKGGMAQERFTLRPDCGPDTIFSNLDQ
jgi:hypothetical protein